MALAHVISTSARQLAGSSLTMSGIATGADANNIYLIYVTLDTTRTVSSITWNGSSTGITQITSRTGTSFDSFAYFLVGATGTANLVVTASGGVNVYCSFTCFSGANQSIKYTATATDNFTTVYTGGLATSLTYTLSTIQSNSWLSAYAWDSSGGISDATHPTPSGLTYRSSVGTVNGNFDSNGTVSVGSQTVSLGASGNTLVSSTDVVGIAVTVSPAVTSQIKSMNGLTLATIKSVDSLAIASVKSINILVK